MSTRDVSARRASPRPWHVVLSPLVPLLALASGGVAMIRPSVVIWPIAVVTFASLLGWAALTYAVGNSRTSALAVSMLSMTALSEATFASIGVYLHFPAAVVVIPAAAVFASCVILQRKGPHEALTTFANVLVLSLLVLVAWPLLRSEAQAWRSRTPVQPPLDLPPGAPPTKPDIFVLVLDAYGRADVLHDYYGFDNALVSRLASLGFFVGTEASSNYAQTAQSLASSLNLDYLQSLLGPPDSIWTRSRLADLISRNRTFATLKAAGYSIRAFGSEYSLLQPGPADRTPHPLIYLNDFDYGLYEGTVLPLLSEAVGLQRAWAPFALHRHHIQWTLERLLDDGWPREGDPPTLTFAHLLCPHPPFVFEEDGRNRQTTLPATFNDGSHWRERAARTSESYQEGYADAVKALNPRLAELMARLVNRKTGRPAILYIQGDHGPGSRLQWEDPVNTDMRERLGILLAVRFPNGEAPPMSAHATPVNAMRLIVNRALGTHLPTLDDRNYFSTWSRPSEYIDVTSRLRQAPPAQ